MAMTTDRIEIKPAIMMGKPVIRGTRITVELILRKLAEGASEGELLQDYPHLSSERCARRAMMWLRLPKSREASKGTRAAPPVLCVLYTTHPALTRWAKVCRAYGAGTRPSRHGPEERWRARHSGCCPESSTPCPYTDGS